MADDNELIEAIEQILGSIHGQLGYLQEIESHVQQAVRAAKASGSGQVSALLPSLLRLQTASASLSASVDSLFRFVGVSGTSGMSIRAAVAQAAPAAAAAPPPPAPAAAAPEPPPPPPPAPEPVAAPAEPPPAEAPAAVPSGEVDVETLPDDMKRLHKKAARFSRVAVQEFLLYKKSEAEEGRKSKDLYQRFKEEIDKTKEQYDEKFSAIREHNIDYFYKELVKTLANNDADALAGYPHS